MIRPDRAHSQDALGARRSGGTPWSTTRCGVLAIAGSPPALLCWQTEGQTKAAVKPYLDGERHERIIHN